MYKTSRVRKHKTVRKNITGTGDKPRLSVYRSTQHIYVQVIDDEKMTTLVSASDLNLKGTKTERAKLVGIEIAKKAIEKKIKKVVFDRGGFLYHGRIAALATGAREGGLEF